MVGTLNHILPQTDNAINVTEVNNADMRLHMLHDDDDGANGGDFDHAMILVQVEKTCASV